MKFIISFLLLLSSLALPQLMYKEIEFINFPFFSIDIKYYIIINLVLIFLLAFFLTLIFKKYHYSFNELSRRFIYIAILNHIIYLLYVIFSFVIISPFLSFTFKLASFIALLYLHEELCFTDKKDTKILVPSIIWNFYLTLVTLSIFIINS